MNNLLTLNKQRFALAGDWSAVSSTNELPVEINKMCERFYTVLHSNIGLTYLGKYTLVKKPAGKVYSLASALHDIVGEFIQNEGGENHNHSDFLFLCDVGSSVYMAAYRDGSLDVLTDTLYENHLADDKITSYVSKHSLKHLYYYGNLLNIDSVLIKNQHLVPNKYFKSINNSHLIKDSKSGTQSKELFLSIFIGLLGLGFLVFLFYDDIFANKTVQEVTGAGVGDAEIEAFKKDYIENKLVSLYSPPLPVDLIENCGFRKNDVYTSVNFWERQLVTCNKSDTSFNFKRNDFGLLPSQFKANFLADYNDFNVSFSDALPPVATVKIKETYDPRVFLPQSVDELKPIPYEKYLDVLTSFSDIGKVIAHSKSKRIVIPPQYIRETEISFDDVKLWNEGTFTLSSNNLSNIKKATELLNDDYLFLSSIKSKGENYEAKYTYISL